jgi:IclR family pca regulon transcriptional regulator
MDEGHDVFPGAASTAAPAGPRPGDTYVQSFARGLSVIRSFGADAPSQTLTEVARRTGLTRAGARRILLTLEGLGYVTSEARRFRLTPRILDLGFAYLSSHPLWRAAGPVMEGMVADLKESSSAAVLDGGDIVYVLRMPTQNFLHETISVGSRLPAHCTSLGRVLLAALPAEARQNLLEAHPPVARTTRTVTDTGRLQTMLDEVNRQGWALVDQEDRKSVV